jgi:hypothetical protein
MFRRVKVGDVPKFQILKYDTINVLWAFRSNYTDLHKFSASNHDAVLHSGMNGVQ